MLKKKKTNKTTHQNSKTSIKPIHIIQKKCRLYNYTRKTSHNKTESEMKICFRERRVIIPLCQLLIFTPKKDDNIRTEQEKQHEKNGLFLKCLS